MTTRMTRGIGWLAAVAAVALPAVAMAASTAAAAPAEAEDQPGLLSPQMSSAIFVLIIFLVLVAILGKFAWPNVLAGLNARQRRITRDIADAEAARVKAEASVVEYNKQLATAESQVRELLAKAAVDAERIGATIRAKAQQEADEAKDRALKDIEASRRQALTDIYEQAATLATTVAEKILRREINPADQKALVDESLKQMQSVS